MVQDGAARGSSVLYNQYSANVTLPTLENMAEIKFGRSRIIPINDC